MLGAVALVVSHAYSAGPLRLSYRIASAPALLGVAYVVVPYSLGIVAAGGPLAHLLARRSLALYLLFVARIVLKDFRDRRGDARYGKPTLLLRFGKTPTCGVSLVALLAADAVLAVSFAAPFAFIAQPFVAAIALMLVRLGRADDPREEQVAIGIGARIGNGLLLGALAWLLLAAHTASQMEAVAFEAVLAALFLGSSASLALRPQDAVLGYKG
jgi:4-hydroxybenzoate polyprenyltransferase